MWILIILFGLLFLLLLLSMPLIVEARMRLSARGAVVHARVYLFGLIPIPVRLRLCLLEEPYFTLMFGKKRIGLFERRKRARTRIEGIRLLRLDTKATVGIENEPAASVMLAGTVAVLLSMFTTRVAESGSAQAGLSELPVLRLSAKARAIAEPVRIVCGIVHSRRIARRKAANNTRKSIEKRTTYASC